MRLRNVPHRVKEKLKPLHPYQILETSRAQKQRESYEQNLAQIAATPLAPKQKLDISMYSYTGVRSLPEQILSLRSFLRYQGEPNEFIVVSDGSLSEEHKRLIEANHSCVQCVEIEEVATPESKQVAGPLVEYLRDHFFWRKVLIITTVSLSRKMAVYTDSDVLFFPSDEPSIFEHGHNEIFYMRDCKPCYDARLFNDPKDYDNPTNSGLCVFGRTPDWESLYARVAQTEQPPWFHSEQTMIHLMMHANGAKPLDPKRYIVEVDDEGRPSTYTDSPHTVLRHYVSTVRAKMWTRSPEFYE